MPDRWYPTTFDHQVEIGGFTVTLQTDKPCHLWLYYSPYQPWVHKTSLRLRGLITLQAGYWCFVVRTAIEQNEAGDTLTHTFTWQGWTSCITQWFFMQGTINTVESPSQSPIFHLHYPYLATIKTYSSDAFVHRSEVAPYFDVRNAPAATLVDSTGDILYVGQRKIGATYYIWRTLLYFDLANFEQLPFLKYAILELWPRQNRTPQDFLITVCPATGVSDPPILADYGLLPPQYTDYGNISTLGIPEGFGHFDCKIHLNNLGLAFIKYNPTLKLALVSSKDILAIAPSDIEQVNFWSYDHGGMIEPRLHLFYEKL